MPSFTYTASRITQKKLRNKS